MKTAYILGAGASLAAGYPLAGTMLDAFRVFTASLDGRPRCQKLKQACDEVVQRMVDTGSKTIDEFAYVMRSADGGRHVPIAKAVMSALFLHLERTADLAQYRRAVRTMIDFTDLGVVSTKPGQDQIRTRSLRGVDFRLDRHPRSAPLGWTSSRAPANVFIPS
jgi:hypothetical protein